jgi:hypothetical protein
MTEEILGRTKKLKIKKALRVKPTFENHNHGHEEPSLLFEENEWEAKDEWGFELD